MKNIFFLVDKVLRNCKISKFSKFIHVSLDFPIHLRYYHWYRTWAAREGTLFEGHNVEFSGMNS